MIRHRVFNKVLLALFLLLIIFPFVSMTILAFFSRWPIDSSIPLGFTVDGFRHFFSRDIDTAVSSVAFSVTASALTLLICTPAVYGLSIMPDYIRRWLEPLFYIPMLLPVVSVCISGHKLFLHLFSTGWWAVMMMHIYFSLPYVFQVVYLAHMHLGRKSEVAAKNLGADPLRVFFMIHLPVYLPDYLLAYTVGFVISYSQYFVNFYFGNADSINFSMIMTPLFSGSNRNIASVYTLMYILFGSVIVGVCSILQHIIHRNTSRGVRVLNG